MEGGGDEWLADDKLHHVIFCSSLTLLFSILAARTRYPFIRRRSMAIGSFLSLLAGAAKEVADQLGFFHSAGASAKDAVADLVGVLVACLAISLSQRLYRRPKPDPDERIVEVSIV